MTKETKGNIYILMAALFWSTGGLLLKYIHFEPIVINGVRSLFAFLVFCIYRRRITITLNKIIVLAAICLTFTTLSYVAANKLTTAANAIVLQYTAPIWVLIWHSLYQKKKPRMTEIIAMLLAFSGTVLFFFDGLTPTNLLGNMFAIFSGITFSGVLFLNFLPSANSEESSTLAFGISFLISIPWLSSMGNLTRDTLISSWIFIAILGVFQVGVAYIMFSRGSRLTVPVTASLIDLLEAVLNPIWVYLFYGEKIGRFALIGAAFILLAVVFQIVTSQKKE